MKTVERLEEYGSTIGWEVRQSFSVYNPTLHFGPCSVTLSELFEQGYYLYSWARYAGPSRFSFSTNLYLCNSNVRYKLGTISIKQAFHDQNDLGKWVDRHRDDMEMRGSRNSFEHDKQVASLETRLAKRDKEIGYTEALNADKSEAEWPNQRVKTKLHELLGNGVFVKSVDPATFKPKPEFSYTRAFALIKEGLSPKPDFTEMENLRTTISALEVELKDANGDPFDKIMEMYPRQRRDEIMIGNRTLREHLLDKFENLSLQLKGSVI